MSDTVLWASRFSPSRRFSSCHAVSLTSSGFGREMHDAQRRIAMQRRASQRQPSAPASESSIRSGRAAQWRTDLSSRAECRAPLPLDFMIHPLALSIFLRQSEQPRALPKKWLQHPSLERLERPEDEPRRREQHEVEVHHGRRCALRLSASLNCCGRKLLFFSFSSSFRFSFLS